MIHPATYTGCKCYLLRRLSIGLASTAFLFATDAAQCWQGYRSLFVHWQSRPQVARHVRERLKMVSALFPEVDQVRADGGS